MVAYSQSVNSPVSLASLSCGIPYYAGKLHHHQLHQLLLELHCSTTTVINDQIKSESVEIWGTKSQFTKQPSSLTRKV